MWAEIWLLPWPQPPPPVSPQAFRTSPLHTPCKERRATSTPCKTLHPATSTCCSPVAHVCQQVFALSPAFPFGPPCPFFLLPRGAVGTVVLSPGVRFSGSRNRKESVNLPSVSPSPAIRRSCHWVQSAGWGPGHTRHAKSTFLWAWSIPCHPSQPERKGLASCISQHLLSRPVSFSCSPSLGRPQPPFFLVSPVCLGWGWLVEGQEVKGDYRPGFWVI